MSDAIIDISTCLSLVTSIFVVVAMVTAVVIWNNTLSVCCIYALHALSSRGTYTLPYNY